MKKILYILALAAAVLSCMRTPKDGDGEGYFNDGGLGRLSLDLSSNDQFNTKADNASVADLKISIVRKHDRYTIDYDRFGDMPQIVELGSGEYTLNAESPVIKDADWDLPIYGGSADFVIRTGELTAVSLVCGIQNVKVTFVLSANFTRELSNYTVSVTNAASWDAADVAEKTLQWDKDKLDNNAAGFFTVAPLLIHVYGYRAVDGEAANLDFTVSNVKAKDHHIITLDANVTGQVGGIQITLDDSVNAVTTDVDVPGFDEVPVDGPGDSGNDDPTDPQNPDPGTGGNDPQPSTAPTMTWAANPTFAPTPITDPMDVNILIEAPKGIKSFVVNVNSDALSGTIAALGATDHGDGTVDMDMIENDELCENLDGMGLGIPTKDALKDQTSVLFSLSNLIPMINVYSPAPGSEHIFTLSVVDNDNQSLVQPIVFVAQ